jgi:cobalt transporter subunit CbtA
MFKRILSAAALAGVMSGVLLTVIQQIEIVPLIEAAEAREAANVASQAHQHSEANQSWTPHDGWERALATAVSNIILAIAFALLLSSAMSLRRSSGWRAGLVWAIAGYVVFFVAPALGLRRSCPGRTPRRFPIVSCGGSAPRAARRQDCGSRGSPGNPWCVSSVRCCSARRMPSERRSRKSTTA